jgi:hypothetical protein
MYSQAAVSFSSGAGTISYSSFTAVVYSSDGPSVSQVTVDAAGTSVDKGATLQFSAAVTGTGNPAQTVSWSITGDHAAGTAINNGLLLVAAGETASSLTIRATSTADPSKYGEKTVTVTGSEPGPAIPAGSAVITINFKGPANENIVVSGDITPDYDPEIPVLENGVWKDDSNPVKHYQFYARTGTTYSIAWNDKDQGKGDKTADIGVSASWAATNAEIFPRTDHGWITPQTFTADRSGIVVLKVEYYSGGGTTGTYAVQYTAPESTSLTLSVADAGTYDEFLWMLDGVVLSGTTGSITIDTSILAPGTHRATVFAVKAGKRYSHEVPFRING